MDSSVRPQSRPQTDAEEAKRRPGDSCLRGGGFFYKPLRSKSGVYSSFADVRSWV